MRLTSIVAVVAALGAGLAPPAFGGEGGPIDLSVSVAGVVATTAPGPVVTAGEPIVLTYELRNATTDWLWSSYLYQEGVGRIQCPERHLAPGARVVCEVSVTAATGAFARDAYVTAWPDGGDGVEDSETVYYTGVASDPSSLVNLALGRPATQASSNRWGVATPPGLAVDGNRDGNHHAGSVAITYRVSDAWWEVDLGAVRNIDHVMLRNRTDCCSERLRRFHVFVSDEPFTVKDIKGTVDQPGVFDYFHEGEAGRRTRIPVGRTGRYVRIQLDYVDAVLQLAEVEVMGSAAALPASGQGGSTAGDRPSVSLWATVNGAAAGTAPGPVVPRGGTVTLDFHVVNTGAGDLHGLRVRVAGLGGAECPYRRLAPGESVDCTLVAPAAAGTHALRVRTVALDDAGGEVEDSAGLFFFVPDGSGASVKLDFLVDGLNGDVPAGPRIKEHEVMTFTYLVVNTGSVPLTGVAVRDDRIGTVTCPSSTVAPGMTLVCVRRLTARLTETSILARVDTAQGVADTERLYYHVRPLGREDDLVLEVTINGIDADAAPGPALSVGATATIRYVLTNNASQSMMWSAQILDPKVPASALRCTGGPSLGHYQSMVCTATIRITAGGWSNQVVGQAWSSNGPRLDASDRVHYYGMP